MQVTLTAMLLLHLLSGPVSPMIASCADGGYMACTMAGCAAAQKDCMGGRWTTCYCAVQTCDDAGLQRRQCLHDRRPL
jgi:hypothetical protein